MNPSRSNKPTFSVDTFFFYLKIFSHSFPFFDFLARIRRCEFSWVCGPRWTVPQIYPGRVWGKNISTGQFYIKGMRNNRSIENLLYNNAVGFYQIKISVTGSYVHRPLSTLFRSNESQNSNIQYIKYLKIFQHFDSLRLSSKVSMKGSS